MVVQVVYKSPESKIIDENRTMKSAGKCACYKYATDISKHIESFHSNATMSAMKQGKHKYKNEDDEIEKLKEEPKSYVVMEVHYRYGEYAVYRCNSEQELRNVLIEHISLPYPTPNPFSKLDLENTELTELVRLAKKKGEEIISNQSGCGNGIVSVIEGKEL